jgi:putative heme-binding domain-containing protein
VIYFTEADSRQIAARPSTFIDSLYFNVMLANLSRTSAVLSLLSILSPLAIPGLAGRLHAQVASHTEGKNDYQGPVRIAKLLWNGNPKNAANTLRNSFNTALDRGDWDSLKQALALVVEPAGSVVAAGEPEDARFAVSLLILLALQEDFSQSADLPQRMTEMKEPADRELVWRVWMRVDQRQAFANLDRQLSEGELAESQTLIAAVRYALERDSYAAGKMLLERWAALPRELQVSAIEPMTSNARGMLQLVAAVQAGLVSKDMLNTNQLRKWLDTNQPELAEQIEAVWGRVRVGDNAGRQQLVKETVELLRSGVAGSVSRGEVVFQRVCSQCHVLHGKGYEVGPDITGNGRGNLDQLVSNILDPSLVIGEAFQAKLVLTADGQVLSGLKAGETERYLKIKLQGGKIVELDKEYDIEEIKDSEKSLMPEGLEEQLNRQELIDLFAYLSLLKPLGADDNELIPGTPDSLVEP